jgi:hypothetical protein
MVQQKCIDCRSISPTTESSQTLISQQHGWRLTRVTTPTGAVVEWRCPECWARFKETRRPQF